MSELREVSLIGGKYGGSLWAVHGGPDLPPKVMPQGETYMRFGRTSCYVHESIREVFRGHHQNEVSGVREQDRTRPPHLRPVP